MKEKASGHEKYGAASEFEDIVAHTTTGLQWLKGSQAKRCFAVEVKTGIGCNPELPVVFLNVIWRIAGHGGHYPVTVYVLLSWKAMGFLL